jgi:hypothetical protein
VGEYHPLYRVIISKAFYSKFVYGNYKQKPQWKPIPGSFSLLGINSLVELHHWMKQELPSPFGKFMFQSVDHFKYLGQVENNPGGISVIDGRSAIARFLKKKSERAVFREW